MMHTRHLLVVLLSILAITVCEVANGYELATHATITQKAFERSVLGGDPRLLKALGIDQANANPFGEIYFDISGTDVRPRSVNDFERTFMPRGSPPLSVQGWLMRGAIREDDWTGINLLVCRIQAPNPQDDPYPDPPDRPKHHFYDPVYDRALTFLGVALGEKAPNWALGTSNAFTQPLAPNPDRRNHFTLFDAYEAMYRALTGRDSTGKEVAKTREERNRYWATTFRALGDIVHLIQDMAQPQHTSDGSHADPAEIAGVSHEKAW